ncbi:hypothetical protein ACFWN2_40360 [Lentzea sp. NPDC058436]|uniref:hypothetical protein n=1 Tax=Lentzea sp. NPDC058436 TaxID=3346499 RepID=UPI00365D8875
MPTNAARAHRLEAWTSFSPAYAIGLGVSEPGERQDLVAFDAESEPARELLARFEAFASVEPR